MTPMPEALEAFLPESTRVAWRRVAPHIPDGGYLAGGTALTTHLLHRLSRDLDFFIRSPFDPEGMIDVLGQAGRFQPTQLSDGTLLNGIFEDTKVQLLDASTQHMLDETRPRRSAGSRSPAFATYSR